MTAAHPLIEGSAAVDHPNFVGTCDWGNCSHVAIAMRWSSNGQEYLAVCWGHANNKRTHDDRCEEMTW